MKALKCNTRHRSVVEGSSIDGSSYMCNYIIDNISDSHVIFSPHHHPYNYLDVLLLSRFYCII